MIVQNHRAMAVFAVVVALMAALAAAVGVFARGDGSYEVVTSVRGVTYAMATSGVYAYNALRVVSEGVGWDVFTLFVAVPTLLAAATFVARGSFRGRLLASGLLGYFFYQYLEYAMTWAFGPLFPLFILIFGASLIGLVWFGASMGGGPLRDRLPRPTVRRRERRDGAPARGDVDRADRRGPGRRPRGGRAAG
ncbi:MAG TPA: hypothetical protein VFN41_05020 [Candidatus Limnocylindrales bacterium]|nr:hypothetical protein [Candidatus Limnocylindrales bacterium]